MQHIRALDGVNIQNAWLTIGSFDGVHLGHQEIVRRLIAGAHAEGAQASVLTFYPHPAVVLAKRRQAQLLTGVEQKAALLSDLGVDLVITHPFDEEVASHSARQFLVYLRGHIGFRELWVGHDFAMGRDRDGNLDALQKLGAEMGFRVQAITPVELDGIVVSSSRIRQSLFTGDVTEAARLLGRPFALKGEVVRGEGRGKTLGIPTANLAVPAERAVPGTGVYVCQAKLGEKVWGAVTNIGVRPTFGSQDALPVIEAHILDFYADLYNQQVELIFLQRLRGEKQFSGPQALVEQIRADIAQARQYLD
jgi:riboflavin kinase/FMN adenylyltransferase